MPEQFVKLDSGELVPLADCDWVFVKPCGCPLGCMYAQGPDYAAYEQETAFRLHYDEGTKRETDKRIRAARQAGVTAVLVTREYWARRYMPIMLDPSLCTHKIPIPAK